MELRQLQAFVAVATELHFGRAAERLLIAQPTLSELISRLERELGAQLFTRTTRRVTLTPAGTELLSRGPAILVDVSAAADAVRHIAAGTTGTVRIGMTPPVAFTLAPFLKAAFADAVPDARVDLQRFWLPKLMSALVGGAVDVALTCGLVPNPPGVASRVVCAEPLVIGVRPDHHLAAQHHVTLRDLENETLGRPSQSLFPAWALAQQQALAVAEVTPPEVDLDDIDLAATRWQEQRNVAWILLLGSFTSQHNNTVIKALPATHAVPYSLLWCAQPETGLVRRFIEIATVNVPEGWQRPVVPSVE